MAVHLGSTLVTCLSRGSVCRICRTFSTTSVGYARKYMLVIVGGGAGGCSIASKFCSKLGKGKVAVIEPSMLHYYQSMWTLVGAGIKKVGQSVRPMERTLPSACTWIQNRAVEFDPERNTVTLASGEQIGYDFLVVAMGIQMNYDKIPGLLDALKSDPMVCSNYSRKTVEKTYAAVQSFRGGEAIFTLPNTRVNCPGAPQKVMYLAEDYWRKNAVRAHVQFNTALDAIFGVPKYASALTKITQERNISVNFKRNLVEVKPDRGEAVFEILGSKSGEKETYKYDFLHVTPPMSVPDCLGKSRLAGLDGWMSVDKESLQHTKYDNVFGIGDCVDVPTSKTAAAVAAQGGHLRKSLHAVMKGDVRPKGEYDGYTSCPIATGDNRCILAEFDYNCEPLETFPIDQAKERKTMFLLKCHIMPQIYWNLLVRGRWEGPGIFRRAIRLWTCK